ncbi:MAG: DsbA family protein [Actinomycetota bacterium]|nr:DsbA family protein [Actinomycetota bacterium]
MADLEFFFDPVCPFCWVASEWVRAVQRQRGIDVRWRFISLRILNEGHYDEKPEGYPQAHQRGLEMLRVAAAARAAHGEHVLGGLYRAMGQAVWHAKPPGGDDFQPVLEHTAEAGDLETILAQVGLSTDLAAAAQGPVWDRTLRAETDEALERVGGGGGTPILSFAPPDGPAFFGPVISEVPDDQSAVRLWEAVETLAHWPGFAELKRSLRQFPNTPVTRHLAGEETQLS